jgi:hypothetical protein
MSCYQCSDRYIATIAIAYAIRQGLPMEEAQLLANKLKNDNITSVNYRYDEQTPFSPCSLDRRDSTLSYKELVGLCNCLEYQSCDPHDYDNLTLRAIRAAFAAAGRLSEEEVEKVWTTTD